MKVRTGCVINSDISATFADESTPPERNTPNGTSAIMRLRIESRSSFRMFCSCSVSVSFARRLAGGKRVPILFEPNVAVAIDHQHMTRGNFLNSRKRVCGAGVVTKGEVVIERFFIDFRRYGRMLQDAL